LQDIIAILGIDELSEDQKVSVARLKNSALPVAALHVAEQFTGSPGRHVKVADTVKGLRKLTKASTTTSRNRPLHEGHH
jgi:F-type H+-transporting ATPase subunit beta